MAAQLQILYLTPIFVEWPGAWCDVWAKGGLLGMGAAQEDGEGRPNYKASMCALASATMRETSSSQLGRSSIRPAIWPLGSTPSAGLPSTELRCSQLGSGRRCPLPRLRQVVVGLQAHPELRVAPANALKPQRHFRRYSGVTVQQPGQPVAGHAQLGRAPRHSPANFLHAAPYTFTGMWWIAHGGGSHDAANYSESAAEGADARLGVGDDAGDQFFAARQVVD